MFGEIVNDALAPSLLGAGVQLAELTERLDQALEVDPATGAVQFDAAKLLADGDGVLRTDTLARHLPSLEALAADGVAVVEEDGGVTTIPWRLFRTDTPDEVAAAAARGLGFGAGEKPGNGDPAARVTKAFPTAPEFALSRMRALDGSLFRQKDDPKEEEVDVGGPVPTLDPAVQAKIKESLACFGQAEWRTYAWGFSIGFKRPCALTLQTTLELGGGVVLSKAAWAAVQAGTLTGAAGAAIAAAGSALALALAALAGYIALSIRLNVTSKGVWLSGNWPVPGFAPTTVWCKGM